MTSRAFLCRGRGFLEFCDLDLRHLHHRSHCPLRTPLIGIVQQLHKPRGRDLPHHAEAIFDPAKNGVIPCMITPQRNTAAKIVSPRSDEALRDELAEREDRAGGIGGHGAAERALVERLDEHRAAEP